MEYNEYALLVKNMLQQRFRKYDKKIIIHHQKPFTSESGNKYVIDFCYEMEMAGLKYLTLIECRLCDTKITKEKVEYFKSIVDDLKAEKGIIVSSRGFQRRAIELAKSNNIGLLKITPLKEEELISHFDGGVNKAEQDLLPHTEVVLLNSPLQFAGLFGTSMSAIKFIGRYYGKNLEAYLNKKDSPYVLDTKVIQELVALPEDWDEEYVRFETCGLYYPLANGHLLRVIKFQIGMMKTKLSV